MTFVDIWFIIVLSTKGGGYLSDKPKMGRPTDNPKPNKLTVRVSDESLQTLDDYCEKKQIGRADGIRDAIDGLKNK